MFTKIVEEIKEKIDIELGQGRKLKEISKEHRVDINTIRKYAKITGKHELWRKKRYFSIDEINAAIQSGERSLEKLAVLGRCKPIGFIRKYEKLIDFPDDLIPYRCRPKIDDLIEKGLTLEEIGDDYEVDLSKERVRQYIKFSGQYEYWEKKRNEKKLEIVKERKKINEEKQGLVNLIYLYGKEKAKKSGFAYEKAGEYYFTVNNSFKFSFEKLVKLYSRYKELVDNDIKFSYNSLGKELGIGPAITYTYLNDVGLNSGRYSEKVSENKIKLIKRALNLNMGVSDIAYFTNINDSTISFYKQRSEHHKRKLFYIYYGKNEMINYRTASKTYEALDLKFSKKEVIELLDLKEKAFDYLKENRKKIETKIISDLKVLYPDKTVEKPYL